MTSKCTKFLMLYIRKYFQNLPRDSIFRGSRGTARPSASGMKSTICSSVNRFG